jgi:7-cyano-7-deazaguanine synthase
LKSILLLSGGLDSTVLLADRFERGDYITCISFDYGQTHRKELQAAKQIAKYYRVRHRIVGLGSVTIPSALTGSTEIPDGHADSPDATTVPARNMIFVSIAAAIAESEKADSIFIGANADDHNGYLDCRPMFLNAMAAAVKLGTSREIRLMYPFLNKSKREIVDRGHHLLAPLWMSWSCYRGGEEPCGTCGACESRKDAGA